MYALLKMNYGTTINELILCSSREKAEQRAKDYIRIFLKEMNSEILSVIYDETIAALKLNIIEFLDNNLVELAFEPLLQLSSALLMGVDLRIVEVLVDLDS